MIRCVRRAGAEFTDDQETPAVDETRFAEASAALASHAGRLTGMSMRDAFAADPERFSRFSLAFGDLFLDWSKSRIDDAAMAALFEAARAAGVEGLRDAMFAGQPINNTENRAVLHVALRAAPGDGFAVDGRDVMGEVHAVLDAMARFAEALRKGEMTGATGKRFTDVVNIGIGGSDLGPVMVTRALAPWHDGPRLHYVSNVDGAHLADTLKGLDPATTLFIVASKTFTTVETMTNAASARVWIAAALGESAVGRHFAAVSTALDKVAAFGIDEARVFGFWDWVGGRYSVWSAIGLPVMIAIGPENFRAFLAGARAMDVHFRSEPLETNLPVILGLIGYWNRRLCGWPTRAVIPYDQRLDRLPAYLQQLDMESNGKGVTRDGEPVSGATGPVVWGEPGTNGQHAFFQLIHQGTDVIPVEFILAAMPHETASGEHHPLLMANCLAQAEALMRGRTFEEALAQARGKGLEGEAAEFLARHRTFAGNRPSVTILHRQLTPFALGRLIALYEHRVFVEAALFGINAYDQWGVELGKELATALLPVVKGEADAEGRDSSTAGLVEALARLRGA
ncbi:MAG: glucose-6-phosphate isomerase [Brucellaceae bacterium]|uniref:glucose-6-phosphate isomerase n=1 Tax=Zhengella sp. TaxID=2282762 RepID=UPI001DE0E99D|nr:glucose-6-phosphate isomerase [Notoacmeibacter sp.]MCC0025451.1 glucose-6-phosphate isomerase [Brucellaceae bacterium]